MPNDQMKPRPPPRVSIFNLPLEIRHQIYDSLIEERVFTWPVPSVGFASISHWPPSPDVLDIHPQIAHEFRNHFYSTTNLRFTLGRAFRQWQYHDHPRISDGDAEYITKVEVMFIIGDKTLNSSVESLCLDLRRRVSYLCNLFSTMARLKVVVISWTDMTRSGLWDAKASILLGLGQLNTEATANIRKVQIVVGNVVVTDSDDRNRIIMTINSLMAGSDKMSVPY
ncbi:uncharacterized protein K489DRAFT_376605 [Dissoconium aciculare CBS 342.82]|jgi:hypothetical protein|uniref:F-box domain-containing protein n=1 Tax=Dissoconium aciculare CBS 342.82 TaxID=1314786 RepID=A0A6J3ME99_9PEZI|nr:uncharacterized protein K489DRAFT_376605 [Dissoconium aciculare CBS 342.82]KAF1826203.1 hypothetical protein K489DRAFT_376605 [Dissoconium aciculare CBS 342.82]